MQDLPNGGGGRTPSPKGASRVDLCGRGGGLILGWVGVGGGGRRSKHWSPGRWRPSVRHWHDVLSRSMGYPKA